jgi:GAF domain-containing protein
VTLDRISVRLIVAYFLFITAILAATGYVSLSLYEQRIEEDVSAHLNTSAEMKKQLFDKWISDSVDETRSVAARITEVNNTVFLSDYLESQALLSQRVKVFEVADSNGRIIASSIPHNLGENLSSKSYFRRGVSGVYVSEPYPVERGARITVAMPLMRENSTVGVMISHLDMSVAQQILEHKALPGDAERVYLAAGGFLLSEDEMLPASLDLNCSIRCVGLKGDPVFRVYQRLWGNVTLVDEISVKEAMQPLSTFRRELMEIGALLTLLALIGVFFISAGITSPLTQLLYGMESARKQGAGAQIKPSGPFETRLLAVRFNELNAEMCRAMDELQKVHAQMDAVASNIDMGLMLFDTQMNLIYYNRWVSQLREGGHCYELMWNRNHACDVCPVKKTLKSGEMEQVLMSPSGDRCYCVSAYPVKEGDDVRWVVVTLSDVTSLKQREEELLKERERLSAMLSISSALNAQIHLFEVYESIVNAARETLGVEGVVLLLREGDRLAVKAASGLPDNLSFEDVELCSHVMRRGKPQVVVDYHRSIDFLVPEELVRWGVVSAAASPLLFEDEAIGVLSVYSKTMRLFSEDDVSLLQTLSNYAVAAIKRAEQYAVEQQRAEQISELLKASEILNSSLDQESILLHLIEEAVKMTDSRAGSAGVYEKGVVTVKQYYRDGMWGSVDYSFTTGEGVPGWVVRHRRPYISKNALSDPHTVKEIAEELGFKRLLAVPVMSDGELFAVLLLHDKKSGDYTEQDAQLVAVLAHHAAIAIENTRHLQEIKNRQRIIELIYRISSILSKSALTEGLTQCLALIVEFFNYAGGHMRLFDSHTDNLVLIAQVGHDAEWMEQNRVVSLGECGCGHAGMEKKTLTVEVPSEDSRITREGCREACGSLLCTPLLLDDDLIGVMRFTAHSNRFFTAEEVDVVELLAGEIARYIDDATTREQVERTHRWLRLLGEITAHTTSLQPLLSLVAENVAGLLQAHRCLIYLNQPEGFVLREEYACAMPVKNTPLAIDAAAFHRALCSSEAVLFNDALDESKPLLAAFRKTIQSLHLRSLVAVPLSGKQGLIVVHDCRRAREWNRWDVKCLTHVSEVLSLVLEFAEQSGEMRKQSFVIEGLKDELGRIEQRFSELLDRFNKAALQMLTRNRADEIASIAINTACVLTEASLGKMHLKKNGSFKTYFYEHNPPCSVVEEEKLEGVNGYVLQAKSRLRINRLSECAERSAPQNHLQIGAFMGVPVMWRGEVLADLLVARAPGEPPFSDEEERRLAIFAELTALALQRCLKPS